MKERNLTVFDRGWIVIHEKEKKKNFPRGNFPQQLPFFLFSFRKFHALFEELGANWIPYFLLGVFNASRKSRCRKKIIFASEMSNPVSSPFFFFFFFFFYPAAISFLVTLNDRSNSRRCTDIRPGFVRKRSKRNSAYRCLLSFHVGSSLSFSLSLLRSFLSLSPFHSLTGKT